VGWLGRPRRNVDSTGGSAEIQNNIISKRILDLPDSTKST